MTVSASQPVLRNDAPITSLMGKTWRFAPADDRMALAIASQHDVDPVVARLLAGRGIDAQKAGAYLTPKLRDTLPDPSLFRDMDVAVARLWRAIQNNEKVALFGDYDVDGATSTALMTRFLRHAGLNPTLYIPDRLMEGYGPNVSAFDRLIDDGHTLIVTLDCGVMAFDPIARARDRGVDVVVLDHHMAEARLPPAHAIVNPNRLDETAGFRYLAAVGVTFVTLVALAGTMRQNGREPLDLLRHLDLVALGTVCDVVPLIDANRALVAQGLRVMAGMQNPGLRALGAVAGLDGVPTAYHLGFVLGPRLNAGGRLSDSRLGATLLSSDDATECDIIARELDGHNRDRQAIEKHSVAEATGMVVRELDRFSHCITLAHDEWHPGVIGLIAARLKEQFQRPTCIIALDKNGKGKASGRSIGGVDLGAMVINAKQNGLLLDGGGHAMAAGFSVAADKVHDLHAFFTAELVRQFGPALPPPEIVIDSILPPAGVTLATAQNLARMEPFGAGNPTPKLVLMPVHVTGITVVKEKHLRLNLSDSANLQRLSVMMFNSAQTKLHQDLGAVAPTQKIAVLGALKINTWQGRTEAQFIGDDIALI